MPFNGPPALPLSGGTVTGSIVIANATDPTKYVTEYVDSSGTLTVTNTAAAAMATITQGGAMVTAGLLQVYGGAANPALIQGSADTGQVHIGLTTGLSGKNIGAVLGNVQGTGAIQSQVTDSTTAGGNARGTNAIDWQTSRTLATQVANGVSATIVGGTNNIASGTNSLAGVSASQATATYAVALGRGAIANGVASIVTGQQGNAHSLYGARVHAPQMLAASGDAQAGDYVLIGRSTGGAAVRLTADAAAAGTTNVCNLPNNTAWGGYCNVIARDTTAGSVNAGHWRAADAFIVRGANAASVVVPSFSFTFVGTGGSPPVAGNLAVSADTTNGGLNLTFTPPNANTWDVVAVFRTAEVQ